jgi:hypothetical protein
MIVIKIGPLRRAEVSHAWQLRSLFVFPIWYVPMSLTIPPPPLPRLRSGGGRGGSHTFISRSRKLVFVQLLLMLRVILVLELVHLFVLVHLLVLVHPLVLLHLLAFIHILELIHKHIHKIIN